MTHNLIIEQTYSIKNISEILKITLLDWQMGKNNLFEHLRDLKILQEGVNHNKPVKCFVDLGLFNQKSCIKKDGSHTILEVTEKGLNWFINDLRSKIEEKEREYWKEKYPKDYAKLLEVEKPLAV
ncbi:MAG: phage antirepressor KilAC domain-containing protein [Sphingobacteriia bacterium]